MTKKQLIPILFEIDEMRIKNKPISDIENFMDEKEVPRRVRRAIVEKIEIINFRAKA